MGFEPPLFSICAWSTLLLALITSFIFLPAEYHPTPLIRLLVSKLAKRVYDEKSSPYYQVFSSLFLTTLIVSCITVLSVGVISFAHFPIAFELLVLFLFISNPYNNPKLKRATWLLAQNQKPVVRDILSLCLRRDTANLSETGIIKAVIEYQSLTFVRQFFVPLLFYYGFGFMVTLVYCLITTCTNAYSKATPLDSKFCLASRKIADAIEYIPLRLFCLPLLLKTNTQSFKYISLYVRNGYNKNSCFLLSCLAGYIDQQLGGPAYYQGIRYSKTRIGPKQLPKQDAIKSAKNALVFASLFWLFIIFLLEVIYATTNYF